MIVFGFKMTAKKFFKEEILEQINELFSKNSNPLEIKKIKKLAMSKNIKLGNLRKKICKKCLTYFTNGNHEIRIKKPFKIIKCKNCGYVCRWKLK